MDSWEKRANTAQVVLLWVCLLSLTVLALFVVGCVSDAKEATEFSMKLAGFEGLNATLGHTLCPVFHLKMHAENPRLLQPLCYNGGEVVVSYSDIALAWGHVARFCLQKSVPKEFLVSPWGRGVGMPDELLGRLTSDWHKREAEITVQMKVFYDDKVWSSSSGKYNGAILRHYLRS
ncbi:hypothetical protein PR202_gb04999 [Eleusine coracana subsp. coracana]|uniref:Uncharacterized protein n=1 Tax=Eleusine coracana subsp. coracana TaxID=191504 RepID=A0AAV5E3H0_ELECO|nr:hypothetical protein PR202_gb04999 [Eleusine coracana subsp. coracana]